MAEVKDGLPSTDFSRMNREYIKAVAENAAGGGGGGSQLFVLNVDGDGVLNKTYAEIKTAFDSGTSIVLRRTDTRGDYYSCVDEPLAGLGFVPSQDKIPFVYVDFFNPYSPEHRDNFTAKNETDYPTLTDGGD